MIDDLHSGYTRSAENSPTAKTESSNILSSENSTPEQQQQQQQQQHHQQQMVHSDQPVIHNNMENIAMAPLVADNNIQASFSTAAGW